MLGFYWVVFFQAHPVYPPLAADLRVYLEYANETWNTSGGFQCFSIIHDIVSALPSNHVVPQLARTSGNWATSTPRIGWRALAIFSVRCMAMLR